MAKRTCAVDGCERPMLAKGLCQAHYERNRRTGNPGSATIRPPVNTVRPPRGTCSVDGCDAPHKSNGYCSLHYQRWNVHGDPTAPLAWATSERHGHWSGDAASYPAVHRRIVRTRGTATTFECQWCDRQAKQWAYDNGDPDERISDLGCRYSVNPEHYLPLCGSCHRLFDNAARKARCEMEDC